MKEDRTMPGRSIRIERAARAVLTAFDAAEHANNNDDISFEEYTRLRDQVPVVLEALRKELP